MNKLSKDTFIFIVILFILVGVLILYMLDPFENDYLADSIIRILYSIIVIIIIVNLDYQILKPETKHGFKMLWFAIPALLISINNFPIIAFFKEQTTITAPQSDIYFFLLQCFTVGLFEELIFRGIVLSLFLQYLKKQKFYILKAMVFSSLLFGLMHLLNLFIGAAVGPTLLQVLYSILTGLMWAAVVILTKNVWFAVVLHAIYNFAGLLYPTLGQVINQFDIWTVTITIVLSVCVTIYYLYHILKVKTISYLINTKKGIETS